MSRKQYSKELKLELVKKHLEDGISYWKLGKEYGIEASIIRRWGHKYEIFGEDGLEKQNADLCNYSAEFKKKIVLEYLGGNITSQDLAAKYKIHAPSTVRTWIKQYNNHEDLTNSRKEGVYLMAKNGARKNTTLIGLCMGYTGSNKFSDNIEAFVRKSIEPFVVAIRTYIELCFIDCEDVAENQENKVITIFLSYCQKDMDIADCLEENIAPSVDKELEIEIEEIGDPMHAILQIKEKQIVQKILLDMPEFLEFITRIRLVDKL